MSGKRAQIWLRNGEEAAAFVQMLSRLEDSFTIESRTGTRSVNAKSLLGVFYSMLQIDDEMFLVNNTHAGMIPSCVDRFRLRGA